MDKPKNYDNTISGGGFTPIELGGHHLTILNVKEMKSKSGREMLAVAFDTASNDSQPGYFKNKYNSDTRSGKKWPNQGMKYILKEDAAGNCNRDLKGFVSAVEISNPGFNAPWGSAFGDQFKGKRIGGVFGEEEDVYNKKLVTRRVLRWFCDDGKAKDQPIPNKRLYKGVLPSAMDTSAINTTPDGFIDVPDGVEDESLPFD